MQFNSKMCELELQHRSVSVVSPDPEVRCSEGVQCCLVYTSVRPVMLEFTTDLCNVLLYFDQVMDCKECVDLYVGETVLKSGSDTVHTGF